MNQVYILSHSNGVRDGEIFSIELQNTRTQKEIEFTKVMIKKLSSFKDEPNWQKNFTTKDGYIKVHYFNDNIVLLDNEYEDIKKEWKKSQKDSITVYESGYIMMSENIDVLLNFEEQSREDYEKYSEDHRHRCGR